MNNPDYEPVKNGGLGAELIKYFYVGNATSRTEPRTIHDFLDDCFDLYHEKYPDLGYHIRRYIQNLINEGTLLYSVGYDSSQDLPLNEQLISYEFDEQLAEYGSYDFVAFGISEVRAAVKDSVIPIFVKRDGEEKERVCSAFVVAKNRLVTALHCLPANAIINIPSWNPAIAKITSIRTVGVETASPPFKQEGSIDLAVLQFDNDPFPSVKKLDLWTGEILQTVLCMGFPPLKGFDNLLVVGTGEIIALEDSYIGKQPYLIFNARVKGGNSGGPILNRLGKVVGVVTDMITDSPTEADIFRLRVSHARPRPF